MKLWERRMYKFIKTARTERDFVTADYTDIVYRVKNSEVTWPELTEEFFHFLKGCGYNFSASAEDMACAASAINDERREQMYGKA